MYVIHTQTVARALSKSEESLPEQLPAAGSWFALEE